MTLFGQESLNTGRQVELDLAKGFAIICMILCHSVLMYADGANDFGFIFAEEILGGPIAAPLFMICLGVGTIYTKHGSPLELARRGVWILLLGYLLNFMRAGIVVLIGSLIYGAEEMGGFLYWAVMCVDILQFAGLALIFLAVMKQLQIKDWQMLAIAGTMSILGGLCSGFDAGHPAINALVGLFVPAGTLNDMEIVSCFPLFNWIIFPVFGVVAGKYLQRCTDKDRLYRNIFLITLPLTLLYVWFVVRKGFTPFSNGEYYWCRLPDALFFIVLDLLAISIFHFLGKVLPGFVKRALSALSFNINTVYCISWILIGWTYAGVFYIMEVPPMNSWAALIPGVALVFVSYWLALGWKRIRNRF